MAPRGALPQAVADGDRPLALIAGGGKLPAAIAEALRRRGRPVFVVAIEEEADRDFAAYPHMRASIGAVARIRQALLDNGCTEIMMAGTFRRPRFSDIELDLGTLRLALSAILRLRFGGDDAVVSSVARIVEGEGFRIVGPDEVVPEMVASEGPHGRLHPSRQARDDIECGIAAIMRMAPLDIGQAVVVHDRRIVAVEAAEGTTAMIERCAALRKSGRINAPAPSGVLVKLPKAGQELRIEMPVVGSETVRAAARAGLAGIAVEAGGVLLADREDMCRIAEAAGLFVFGFRPSRQRLP